MQSTISSLFSQENAPVVQCKAFFLVCIVTVVNSNGNRSIAVSVVEL